MNLFLTAVIKSKAEFATEVKAVLENMVVQSRKESACIQYNLHQGTDDKNLLVFYEIWENEAGLAKHNEQPYIKAFGNLIEEKLQELPVIYLTQKL